MVKKSALNLFEVIRATRPQIPEGTVFDRFVGIFPQKSV
jgi:hypothetical protein